MLGRVGQEGKRNWELASVGTRGWDKKGKEIGNWLTCLVNAEGKEYTCKQEVIRGG